AGSRETTVDGNITPGEYQGGLDAMENEVLQRVRGEPQIEGELRIGITAEAFSRSSKLSERYPVDEATGMRWLDLPLKGSIYKIGVDLAEALYRQSRVDR
ncbi:MAG: hypothetical protein HKO57_15595, partial [Akkermansiaceae bacterium]|nr:hypothetical protein [Akkermansiaceae bacterium]